MEGCYFKNATACKISKELSYSSRRQINHRKMPFPQGISSDNYFDTY
jgi:hypothetical protein